MFTSILDIRKGYQVYKEWLRGGPGKAELSVVAEAYRIFHKTSPYGNDILF